MLDWVYKQERLCYNIYRSIELEMHLLNSSPWRFGLENKIRRKNYK